jgi:hypothetical protein
MEDRVNFEISNIPTKYRQKVSDAFIEASTIFFDDTFQKMLKCFGQFADSNVDGRMLSAKVMNWYSRVPNRTIKVVGKRKHRWSSTIAWFEKRHPNTLFINTRRLPSLSAAKLRGTAIHELLHLIDSEVFGYYWGHVGNKLTIRKLRTAPHFIGLLLEMWDI